MPISTTPGLSRALGRARRLSSRVRDRVRGLPLRAAERGRGLPLPGPRLMHLVAGTEDVAWFLASGARGAACLRSILEKNGLALERCEDVLDFGCGVGRVLRHWSTLPGPRFHGTDYNPDLIDWCRRRLPFAHFQVNRLDGALDDPDSTFDLVYAFSVFTHLSEPLQASWMNELCRVLKPGGHLLMSLHGASYLGRLSPEQQHQFHDGSLVVLAADREGRNDCAAFHPESYVRQHMARDWSVIDVVPEGAWGNPSQDLYLVRKPVDPRPDANPSP